MVSLAFTARHLHPPSRPIRPGFPLFVFPAVCRSPVTLASRIRLPSETSARYSPYLCSDFLLSLPSPLLLLISCSLARESQTRVCTASNTRFCRSAGRFWYGHGCSLSRSRSKIKGRPDGFPLEIPLIGRSLFWSSVPCFRIFPVFFFHALLIIMTRSTLGRWNAELLLSGVPRAIFSFLVRFPAPEDS